MCCSRLPAFWMVNPIHSKPTQDPNVIGMKCWLVIAGFLSGLPARLGQYMLLYIMCPRGMSPTLENRLQQASFEQS